MHLWVPHYTLTAEQFDRAGGLQPAGFLATQTEVYCTGVMPAPIAEAIAKDYVFVAHNCLGFDALVWQAKIAPVPHWWFDTIPGCRAAGLPGGLNDLAKRLLGREKDEGGLLMHRLCGAKWEKVKKAKKEGEPEEWVEEWVYPSCEPGYLIKFLRYNIADVLLLERIYQLTAEYGEADVITAHHAVNERGVCFDAGLANQIIACGKTATERAGAEIERLTAGRLRATDLRSHARMGKWLADNGVVLIPPGAERPNLRKETVNNFLAKPESFEGCADSIDPAVFQVLRLRNSALRITGPKLEKALAQVSREDSRLRDLFVYHGAGPGRWTSHAVQVHNLPRGLPLDVEPFVDGFSYADLEATVAAHPQWTPDDVLSSLIRPCFLAEPGKVLSICDYARIEAVGIAWVAGEQGLLDTFAGDGDVYVDMASKVYGKPLSKKDKAERQIGKEVILGCGYGMGAAKLAIRMASQGINLAAAGVTAQQCVDAYRDAYPRIAGWKVGGTDGRTFRRGGVWQAYDAAVKRAIAGQPSAAGRCHFVCEGGHLFCILPSGRPIVYRNARIEDRVPAYCALYGIPEKPKPTIVYDSPRGERSLYGGKIAENVVQAVCRDLLATTLVRCESAGLRIVLHAHDEAVAEGSHYGLHTLAQLMSEPPPWAEGFPVKVEGFTATRYTKSPFKNSLHAAYLNGKECK